MLIRVGYWHGKSEQTDNVSLRLSFVLPMSFDKIDNKYINKYDQRI